MVRAQASRNRRLQAADDVIDNGAASDTASLTDRVLALDRRYRTVAA
jgi:hypothetical protein